LLLLYCRLYMSDRAGYVKSGGGGGGGVSGDLFDLF